MNINFFKDVGKLFLNFCDRNNKIKSNEVNNKFDINNYINILLFDSDIYNFFLQFNLINVSINNYYLNFNINKNKITNFTLKLYYNKFYIIIKYTIMPEHYFEINSMIKLESYFTNGIKINEKIIYDINDDITKFIIEFVNL
jgi:hypothetical protein